MATQLGTSNNDQFIANVNDLVLGLDGNDDLDAGLGAGENILGGGSGDDTLSASQDDLLLGDTGNDELEATDGVGNKLYGGQGDDQLYTSDNNQLWAGAGNDTVYLVGGNNQVWSGTGRDRLWIALTESPETPNIIEDFDPNQDQIGIALTGIIRLEDLTFEPVGQDVEVKLDVSGQVVAQIKNAQPTDFNENTVIFDNNAPLNNLPVVNNPTEQARNTVKNVEFLGLTSFATGTTFQETQVGGLSGIIYDPTRNVYYAISDDRSSINPARFYGLTVDLSDGSLNDGDVIFTSVTTLRDTQGNPFAVNSLDPEGITLTENGTVYISSEGEVRPDLGRVTNPFVNQFSLSGQQLSELAIPETFWAVDGTTQGIRNNLAFESLTITPDRRYLYTATESALAQDGTIATLENSSLARILKYDLTTGAVVAEFVYEIEPIPQASNPAGGFADNGLVELFALDNNGTLLALERAFAVGVGNTVKLYEIQTQGALNVQGFADFYWEAGNSRFEIDPPVSKRLLVDFAELGITPDNLEGMTLGPVLADGRPSLIVVSDNNFNTTQTTQVIALGLDVQTLPAVLPVVETPETVDQEEGTTPLLGDSDDPAVWIDPTDAEKSLVIGTLKDGGLAVFSLTGEILQTIQPSDILGQGAEYGDIRYNNVDVLYHFSLGEESVDIAVVSDRQNDSLNIFKIDPNTRQLVNITSEDLLGADFSIFGVDNGDATAYGLAGYRSPITGQYSVFVTQASGNQIAQLELQATATGTITAQVIRTIALPIEEGKEAGDYQSEAIAVDQETGTVYLAVEGEIGLVKFAAEPNGGNAIRVVRPVDSPELVPDLEGLAIYYGANGTGYLVASSQGDSTYAVYRREGNNDYLGSFVIGDNLPTGIDQVNETDGLEIINVPLGPNFPLGALLVQDGANEPQNAVENDEELENNATNFKFVRWDDVANAFDTPLTLDPSSYDPRGAVPPLQLQVIGTYATGSYDEGAAEIPAYDPATQRLFVVNAQNSRVDVLDLRNPSQPTFLTSIDTSAFGSPNSVAVKNGLVAIAVENADKQANGQVWFYQANSSEWGTPAKTVTVGALPDMLTFSPDGQKVLVANEGEPNGDYRLDPEGSVSIIDLSQGLVNATAQTANFTAFNSQWQALKAAGIKLKGDVGTTRTVDQDLEPEYIALSPDGTKAWVTLQEANAIAIVDLATATVESVNPLGFKDYQTSQLDASDRDSTINIRSWPIYGLYQPDAIAAYQFNGNTYYLTANEGDVRDYSGYAEAKRIKDLTLDPTAFPNGAELQADANLGRLQVTTELGDTDGDGDYDALYTFGGRSFSIWDSQGRLVADSGDDFEQITGTFFPDYFNASNSNNNFDNRSDDKGPEPEGLVLGEVEGCTYAFIGLERIGGVMVYDVSNPQTPQFVQYLNNRNFTADVATAEAGDLGPEGLTFINPEDSPNGKALLVVANEVSGNTTIYEINSESFNESPTNLTLSATRIDENVPDNSAIGTFATIDPDAEDTFTYSLVAGEGATDNTAFSIVGNQLQINHSPDFETQNSYSIRVKTTDQGGLSFEQVLTITVNNVNESPTDLAISATTVNENVPANSVIGTLTTTDPDAGNTFTYRLVAGISDTDNAAFSIVGNQLQIHNSPDFEAKNSYSVRVKTTDQDGLGFEKVLTITVNDLPDVVPPTDGNFDGIPDTEQSNVTSIQTPNNQFVTFVSDSQQQPIQVQAIANPSPENVPDNVSFPLGFFAFTLSPETTGGASTVTLFLPQGMDVNSYWKFGATLDNPNDHWYNFNFDPVTQTGAEFTDVNGDGQAEMVLHFVDGQRGDQDLTANGQIVDPGAPAESTNTAPTALIFQNVVTELAENTEVTPELKVADLLVEDDGLGTNNLFLTGRDKDRFLIRDLALYYAGGKFNFEVQNNYEVTVNVNDETVGTTPDLIQNFTLAIADVNEAPTAITLNSTTNVLAENTDTSQGIKVANIQITDDALGANTLTLLGSDRGSFEIRGQELFFIGKADFEAQESYDITVAVTDQTLEPSPNATPDATVNFTLEITNLPDQLVSPQTLQFKGNSNGQGSLVLDFSNLSGTVQVKANEEGLKQTGAFFNNIVGLYKVVDNNGAVLDTLDLDKDGNVQELIQPGQAGYARTALSQAVNNFIVRASGEGGKSSTTASEFGDVLLEGGQRYAPFVIANGGNLSGSLKESVPSFLAKNPDNTGATLENFMSHEVAYFSFGAANPDGVEHLRARGNNTFGFEDLPGNLPNISDNDFNDGILAFTFIG